MTHKITDIVAALREMARGDRPDDLGEIHRRLRKRFPNINLWDDEVARAFRVLKYETQEDHREADAEYHQSKKETEEALHIFEGLDKAITFREAVEIRAAQGDAIALRWQRVMSSRRFSRHRGARRSRAPSPSPIRADA
jgi:hypothetical protein